MSTKTLSERLAELTSTAPSSIFNPDDPDYDDGTGAGLSKYGDFDGDDGLEGVFPSGDDRPSSNFRVAADMESIGREYHGKRVSRKDLVGKFTSFDGEGGVSEPEDSEDESSGVEKRAGGEDGDLGAHNAPSTAFSLKLDDVSSSDDQEESEGDDDKALDDHGSDDEATEDEQQHHQSNVFTGMEGRGDVVEGRGKEGTMRLDEDSRRDRKRDMGWRLQGDLKRAREALRQRQWWEGLLEVRILLQRLVNAANQLPGPNELPIFLEGDESLTALAEEGTDAAQDLVKQLSAVRRSQMACWGVRENGSDKAPVVACASSGPVGDSAVGEEGVAEREHKNCMDWWQSVLGRWHEKTRLVDPSLQKKFRVVNQGPWAQIMAVLADRDRANRRSFMTESETRGFLGRKLAKRLKTVAGDDGEASSLLKAREGEAEEEILGRERRRDEAESLDLEVVDDRDFYQHLLKEFMEASSAGGSEKGTSVGVPMRRKSRKKSVDRRASKGRKIKYVTHPKMQNFMFPREYGPPPMEPSELFASLFGVAGEAR